MKNIESKKLDNKEEVFIFGKSSVLTQELKKYFINAKTFNRNSNFFKDTKKFIEILNKNKLNIIIYISGILRSKPLSEQSKKEKFDSFEINTWKFVEIVEQINKHNIYAKVIYISSESAEKGSYDTSYWLSKAATESFIKENRMKNKMSSIIGISPSTIQDAGMTERRKDLTLLQRYKNNHPKKRFLKSTEVVSLIKFIAEFESDYLTNEIIKINGGKFSRRTL